VGKSVSQGLIQLSGVRCLRPKQMDKACDEAAIGERQYPPKDCKRSKQPAKKKWEARLNR